MQILIQNNHSNNFDTVIENKQYWLSWISNNIWLECFCPELLNEYIGLKERNPFEIFPYSNFLTKWKCSKCHFPYMANLNYKVEGKVLFQIVVVQSLFLLIYMTE